MATINTNAVLPEWKGLQEAMDDVRAFGNRTHREKMIILRPDGSRMSETEGDEGKVVVDTSAVHGYMLVHNHPVFAELSVGDLATASFHEAYGVVAVMPDGSWSFAKGMRSLPNDYDHFLWEVFHQPSHPMFEAILASTQFFRDRGVREAKGELFDETVAPANRTALNLLAEKRLLIDYRLHLEPQARKVFSGLTGLDI